MQPWRALVLIQVGVASLHRDKHTLPKINKIGSIPVNKKPSQKEFVRRLTTKLFFNTRLHGVLDINLSRYG